MLLYASERKVMLQRRWEMLRQLRSFAPVKQCFRRCEGELVGAVVTHSLRPLNFMCLERYNGRAAGKQRSSDVSPRAVLLWQSSPGTVGA